MADRLFGLAMALLAVWLGLTARGFQMAHSDPIGPGLFPIVVAVPFFLLSLVMVFRPDPDPDWPSRSVLWKQASAVATMIAFALLLQTLGFPIAAFLTITVLARIVHATWLQALLLGAVTAIALYLIFSYGLGLTVPFAPRAEFL